MLTRLHRRRGRNWRRAARRRQAKAAAAHARPPGRGAAVQLLLDDGERLVHAGERLAYLDALRWLDARGYLTAEHMRAAVRIQAAVRGRQVRAGWADAGIVRASTHIPMRSSGILGPVEGAALGTDTAFATTTATPTATTTTTTIPTRTTSMIILPMAGPGAGDPVA